MLQFSFELAVFLFQLLERALARPGGRQGGQLLFPLLDALGTDAQFAGNLLHRFAALEPRLHGGTFEGFVVSFVFAGDLVFVVHGALCV